MEFFTLSLYLRLGGSTSYGKSIELVTLGDGKILAQCGLWGWFGQRKRSRVRDLLCLLML